MASLVVGLGVAGFIASTWVLHFSRTGYYLVAGLVAAAATIISVAAIARVPLAMIALLGGAAAAGTALLTGTLQLLLP